MKLESNPFQSPPKGRVARKKSRTPVRAAWWTIFLAVPVGLLGTFAAIANLIEGVRFVATHHDFPARLLFWEIELHSVCVAAGIAMIAGSITIAKGVWKRGLAIAVVAIVAIYLNTKIYTASRRAIGPFKVVREVHEF